MSDGSTKAVKRSLAGKGCGKVRFCHVIGKRVIWSITVSRSFAARVSDDISNRMGYRIFDNGTIEKAIQKKPELVVIKAKSPVVHKAARTVGS